MTKFNGFVMFMTNERAKDKGEIQNGIVIMLDLVD